MGTYMTPWMLMEPCQMAEMVGDGKVPWNNFNIGKLIGGSW